MAELTPPLLRAESVHLAFAGLVAVDDVSFEVAPGELFAIIGPNGAGKTSIFNCLCGVYRPRTGHIWFDDNDLTTLRPHEIARLGLARTFQNIELFGFMTVIDNLMLGRHHRMRSGIISGGLWWGRARREELRHRERVEQVVDFLELESYRHLPVATLPYGIQKRVELGRALAMDPTLLLLDEPVAGMNVEETEDMARYILDISDDLGIAQILVEHDMGVVMDIADRVAVLDFGRKIAEGSPSDVQRDPDVIKAYLGEEHRIDAGSETVGRTDA